MQNIIKKFSHYETWYLVQDEDGTEYVLLLETIGNKIPDLHSFYFHIACHEDIIFPLDMVCESGQLNQDCKVGYLYPMDVLEWSPLEELKLEKKEDKAAFLKNLHALLKEIHEEIYMMGIDIRQIYQQNGRIKIRYNGFKNYARNSIYKIPEDKAGEYEPYILDYFSFFVLMFEIMYQWHPYMGNRTSYSMEEDARYYAFSQSPIFIFDPKNESNRIGFLMSQKEVIQRWEDSEPAIRKYFIDIFNLDRIKKYTQRELSTLAEVFIFDYTRTDWFK